MGPTLSGGIGRSGSHIRGAHAPAEHNVGIATAATKRMAHTTIPYALMDSPQDADPASNRNRQINALMVSVVCAFCQACPA